MISVEPRPVAAINVVTRSGATTHIQNMEKRLGEPCVCKAPEKILAFDIEREKETFMEAKKDFADPSTPVAPARPPPPLAQPQGSSMDKVSTLSSFLQSCLKLLRNQNALNELQKVISSCEPQQSHGRDKTVNRVRRTGREMRLHAQIGV